uniref:Late endosomal/lysosomal adaptor and MAPK and MTOR activator 5 n=1 Tax=Rhabditophanes sp. KR3021 TaxID=114890 RepID=A0AC35TU43_9BILA
MLKTQALNRFLNLAVTPDVIGVYLLSKTGHCHARVGPGADSVAAAINSSLASTMWEQWERQSSDLELMEYYLECGETPDGNKGCTIVATKVLNFIFVIQAKPSIPLGQLRTKLFTFADHLKVPLTSVSINDQ